MKKRLRTAVLDDVRKETKLRKIKIQEDQKKRCGLESQS